MAITPTGKGREALARLIRLAMANENLTLEQFRERLKELAGATLSIQTLSSLQNGSTKEPTASSLWILATSRLLKDGAGRPFESVDDLWDILCERLDPVTGAEIPQSDHNGVN